MDATALVEQLIAPTLEAMGYDLVRVRLSGGKQRRRLQVMAERIDESGMTVDDCADISRAVSVLLDTEDPIPGAYDLEVSSPGIDRPLTRPRDFERFAGHEAKIELRDAINGRRRFRGLLRGLEGGNVLLELDDDIAKLPCDGIETAKVMLTDELWAAARQEAQADRRGRA
ncbi:MAG: ribosome maturation factor RimP [Alphaproteobacteria bacterium]|nr:ribosome maturation factor RimP [Alphaproteobacteria bacterium]